MLHMHAVMPVAGSAKHRERFMHISTFSHLNRLKSQNQLWLVGVFVPMYTFRSDLLLSPLMLPP